MLQTCKVLRKRNANVSPMTMQTYNRRHASPRINLFHPRNIEGRLDEMSTTQAIMTSTRNSTFRQGGTRDNSNTRNTTRAIEPIKFEDSQMLKTAEGGPRMNFVQESGRAYTVENNAQRPSMITRKLPT